MEYSTTISSKGQITVPAKIRRSLNVHAGDRLTITQKGQSITIKPDTYEEELAKLRQRAQAHLKEKGLYGLSLGEIKKRSEAAKLQEYIQKHDLRT